MYEQASRTPQAAVSPDEAEEAAKRALPEAARASRAGRRRGDLAPPAQAADRDPEVRRLPLPPPGQAHRRGAAAGLRRGVRERPDAPAFETVAEALRDRLVRRQLDLKVEAWIKELRAAAEIRLVSP